MSEIQVLVLMGGPDAEREISLKSGSMIAAALRESGRFIVHEQVIDRVTSAQLRQMPGDVIFPVLHGPFGEGGPLQDVMEADGRPYIGSRPRAARIAMDKITAKLFARAAGIRTPPARVLIPGQPCELEAPVVVKPIDDGSSVGVRRCFDAASFAAARTELEAKHPRLMAEKLIAGREITVGILERDLLPTIEVITPTDFYDFSAKYERADTQYILDPVLTPDVKEEITHAARTIYERIGCRDLARVDFMVDGDGAWFLEINSMPGMTDHSLVPKAAAHAGISFSAMCARLVDRSLARMKGLHRSARQGTPGHSNAASGEGVEQGAEVTSDASAGAPTATMTHDSPDQQESQSTEAESNG